jgi:hypothetical protein
MTDKPDITADLKGWTFHDLPNGKQIVMGRIYNDTRQRWGDGTQIQTSIITKREGDIITTLNSVYRMCAPDDI